jgi:RNA 2',3'-cyclic 3'-phosphodiesterase
VSAGWRCFVAIPLDDDLRVALADAVAASRDRTELPALRWTEPGSWHLTLAFLGDVAPDAIPDVARTLDRLLAGTEASGHAAAEFGAFPSPAHARVAWIGFSDDQGRLTAMATAVRQGLGVNEDRPFVAHVTLARARSGAVDLAEWVKLPIPRVRPLTADRVELIRSRRDGDRARYETLASTRLRTAAHV